LFRAGLAFRVAVNYVYSYYLDRRVQLIVVQLQWN